MVVKKDALLRRANIKKKPYKQMLTLFLSRICIKTRANRVKSEFQNVASSIPCSSSRVSAFEIASVGPTFFTSTSTFRDENGSRRFLIRKPRQKFRDRKNTFWTSESRRANLTKSCLRFFIIRYLKKRCIFIAVTQSFCFSPPYLFYVGTITA